MLRREKLLSLSRRVISGCAGRSCGRAYHPCGRAGRPRGHDASRVGRPCGRGVSRGVASKCCVAARRVGRASSRSGYRGCGCGPSCARRGSCPARTRRGSHRRRALTGGRAYLLPSTVYGFQVSSQAPSSLTFVKGRALPDFSIEAFCPALLFGKRSAAPFGPLANPPAGRLN